MSLFIPAPAVSVAGFPRVSGDEPDAVRRIEQNQEFSPRERG